MERALQALELVRTLHAARLGEVRAGGDDLQRSEPLAGAMPRIEREIAVVEPDGAVLDLDRLQRGGEGVGGTRERPRAPVTDATPRVAAALLVVEEEIAVGEHVSRVHAARRRRRQLDGGEDEGG